MLFSTAPEGQVVQWHMLQGTDPVFSPSHKDMQVFEGGQESRTKGLQIISLVRGVFLFYELQTRPEYTNRDILVKFTPRSATIGAYQNSSNSGQ